MDSCGLRYAVSEVAASETGFGLVNDGSRTAPTRLTVLFRRHLDTNTAASEHVGYCAQHMESATPRSPLFNVEAWRVRAVLIPLVPDIFVGCPSLTTSQHWIRGSGGSSSSTSSPPLAKHVLSSSIISFLNFDKCRLNNTVNSSPTPPEHYGRT